MPFLTPQAAGERDVLRTYALQQLAQMRTTVHGLDDEQVHATPTASTLSLAALLVHAGEVALYWTCAAASAPGQPDIPEGFEQSSLEDLARDERTLAELLARFDACVEIASERFDAVADLAAPVPTPDVPWIPEELASWEARWVLMHISTEIARHVGHADIIRETIDGKGSYELNDLAEAAGR